MPRNSYCSVIWDLISCLKPEHIHSSFETSSENGTCKAKCMLTFTLSSCLVSLHVFPLLCSSDSNKLLHKEKKWLRGSLFKRCALVTQITFNKFSPSFLLFYNPHEFEPCCLEYFCGQLNRQNQEKCITIINILYLVITIFF